MFYACLGKREMGRFIEGCDRREVQLLPDCIDDYVAKDSQVRVIDVFVDELDLSALGSGPIKSVAEAELS
jgi:transposase